MGLILGPGITNDPRQFRRLIAHLAQKGDGEPCESFIVMCDTLHEKEVVSSTLKNWIREGRSVPGKNENYL